MAAQLASIDLSSFESVRGALNGRAGRKLGYNTRLILRDDCTIAVQYHYTDVVTFRPDGATLDSGGWQTSTTRQRIKEYMPVGSLYQKDYTWYVQAFGETVEFFDGMFLPYAGDGARFAFRLEQETLARGDDNVSMNRELFGDLYTLRAIAEQVESDASAERREHWNTWQAGRLAEYHAARLPQKPRRLRSALSLHHAETKREREQAERWTAYQAQREAREAARAVRRDLSQQ